MAETYVQLPADSTGSKLRAISVSKNDVTVLEQVVRVELLEKATLAHYAAVATGLAVGANVYHLVLANNSGSSLLIDIVHLKVAMNATAVVSGFPMAFRLLRTTDGGTGGTAITVSNFDTDNAALPSQITVKYTVTTPTDSTVIASGSCNPEETGGNTETVLWDEKLQCQPLTVREGEWLAVKQYGTAGVGVVDVTLQFRTRSE